ncbi:hypothetical protein KP509_03G011900 [Ceratopteris richardii]|uniref:Uncharacterized protein n=1 Tax=Ceratopteris richardii TaxID=49495 RepID=A0A8T2V520_CERRI|nr:hypothetical protein KP509_03G011900 [Ceratopteris richardii]
MGISGPGSSCYACSLIRPKATASREAGVIDVNSRMLVHVGTMPMRATPGPAQWVLSSADRFLSVQHYFTILQPLPTLSPCTAYDFQPANPEDPYTVVVALSGGGIHGVILERTLSRLPSKRCWKVGAAKDHLSMKEVAEFNRKWDTTLQLGKHDCRHYTDGLVEFLTGEKGIIQRLKSSASASIF